MTEPDGNPAADRRIALGWCGPAGNGVTLTARHIALAARDAGFAGALVSEPDPARVLGLVDLLPAGVGVLHLHVSDWLFADAGCDPDVIVPQLMLGLRDRGVALTVTLHDLPQPSDGERLYARRAATYRAIVDAAAGVVVSSEHERQLLTAVTSARPAVIPLPIEPLPLEPLPLEPTTGAPPPGRPVVAIFGYLYPGKGHREVLDDLAGGRPAIDLLAIGRPSDRHLDLVEELATIAAAQGSSFRCTGYVPDADLADQLRAAVIPVAPHTHVSASGSINSWIAAGRRPLVPTGRYTRELDERLPGSVWLYPPGGLRAAVAAAIDHPELTWLPADLVVGPTRRAVAGSYLNWLRTAVGGPVTLRR